MRGRGFVRCFGPILRSPAFAVPDLATAIEDRGACIAIAMNAAAKDGLGEGVGVGRSRSLRSPRVLAVGDPLMDLVFQIRDAEVLRSAGFEVGGCVEVDEVELRSLKDSELCAEMTKKCAAGSAANLAKAIAQLGTPADLWGCLGSGPEAKSYADEMSKIDVRCVGPSSTSSIGQCLCIVSPSGERTMRTYCGAAAEVSEKDWDSEVLREYSHTHIEGYFIRNFDLLCRMVRDAKSAGCSVSFDLGSFEVVRKSKDLFDSVLGLGLDVIFCNEPEANMICGSKDLHECLQYLSGRVATAVISLGESGCIAMQSGRPATQMEATKVQCVDTTGAGDFFTAAFLHAHLRGADVESACKLGCTAGAAIVQIVGTELSSSQWHDLCKACHVGNVCVGNRTDSPLGEY